MQLWHLKLGKSQIQSLNIGSFRKISTSQYISSPPIRSGISKSGFFKPIQNFKTTFPGHTQQSNRGSNDATIACEVENEYRLLPESLNVSMLIVTIRSHHRKVQAHWGQFRLFKIITVTLLNGSYIPASMYSWTRPSERSPPRHSSNSETAPG